MHNANVKTIKTKVKSLILLSIILTYSSAFAQYKWTDNKGSIVYSDSPPQAGQNIKNAQIIPYIKPKSKPLPLATQPNKPVEGTLPASGVALEQKKSMLYDKEACEQLQGYLRILQEGGRVAKIQNGEQAVLDDVSRQKEIVDTQRKISEQCKKV